ncbi:MAG: HupE/UreJ family protein [Pseudomonadota bacterium]
MMRALALAFLSILALPGLALAHATGHTGDGLVSGLMHPIAGPDHLVAMVAVGLWGAQLGRPLIYALPLAFPMIMAVGGLIGVAGIAVPGVELGIALSALVLGLVVALAFRAPLWLALALVSAFALFHGVAHGYELPDAASPVAYGVGFMVATGLLHLAGILIGLLNEWQRAGPWVVRGCGALVSVMGLYFLAGAAGLTA